MARLRHNIALCGIVALLLIAVACEAAPSAPASAAASAAASAPTATPTSSLVIDGSDAAGNMQAPTPAAPQYSIFDHTNGHTIVCFQTAGESFPPGENFDMPNVDPATNGVDEWTLRIVEPNDIGDGYRMPVLPDGIPNGECAPLDDVPAIPAP